MFYNVIMSNFPDHIFITNSTLIRNTKYAYSLLADNIDDAKDLALYLFKEDYQLYSTIDHYKQDLAVKDLTFEVYEIPESIVSYDEKQYKVILKRSDRGTERKHTKVS